MTKPKKEKDREYGYHTSIPIQEYWEKKLEKLEKKRKKHVGRRDL